MVGWGVMGHRNDLDLWGGGGGVMGHRNDLDFWPISLSLPRFLSISRQIVDQIDIKLGR